jgi:hypothetical protein
VKTELRHASWVSLILAAVAAILVAPMTAGGTEVPEVPVAVTPASAPPGVIVLVTGLTCGPDWSARNLVGFELTDVPDPPTQDEGVSIYARGANDTTANGITSTFRIPEVTAGPYYFYYLCADRLGSRVFQAMPPGGRFRVDLLRPHPTAARITALEMPGAAPSLAAAAMMLVILGASILAVRIRNRDRR